jgi:regulator of replication initiation timing
MQSQHALEVQTLQATIQSLGEEMAILKIQLEEKASTLEEKLRLEQEREAEAKRLAEQKQQELAQREAEQQRLEEEERIREAALQAQYRQIPHWLPSPSQSICNRHTHHIAHRSKPVARHAAPPR